MNYKRGISASENRKRRSSLTQNLREENKRDVLENLRAQLAKNATFSGAATWETTYKGSAKEKLVSFYKDYNPSKVDDVDKTLTKYAGNEQMLFVKLAERYNVNHAIFGVSVAATGSLGDFGKTLEKYPGREEKHRGKFNPAVFGVGGPSARPFAGNASGGTMFGSLTSPKAKVSGFRSGALGSASKGRKSINSLKTYTEDLRLSSDSESIMECD